MKSPQSWQIGALIVTVILGVITISGALISAGMQFGSLRQEVVSVVDDIQCLRALPERVAAIEAWLEAIYLPPLSSKGGPDG